MCGWCGLEGGEEKAVGRLGCGQTKDASKSKRVGALRCFARSKLRGKLRNGLTWGRDALQRRPINLNTCTYLNGN